MYRDNFDNIWEAMWFIAVSLFIALVLAITGYYWFSTPRVVGYVLGGNSETNIRPEINLIIDNGPDEEICLPNSCTFQEAIKMVDSLNRTLPPGKK